MYLIKNITMENHNEEEVQEVQELDINIDFNVNINLEIDDNNDMVWKETEFEEPHINNIIECVIEDTDEDCKIIHNSDYSSDSSDDVDEMIDKDIEEDLEHDIIVFNKLIKSQMDIRNLMYKQTIKNYIKPMISMTSPRLSLVIIRGIKKMGSTLGLENQIAAIITDILFSFNQKTDIDNFKHLLAPFLVSSLSQKSLLDMIAIIINKHRIWLKYNKVNNLFEALLKSRLVNSCSMVDWYQSLENDSIHSVDKITQETIFEFLDEFIAGLQM